MYLVGYTTVCYVLAPFCLCLSFSNCMSLAIYMYSYIAEQKPDIFAHKLKFTLLPQLIATLNNYTCSLPPLGWMVAKA